LKIDSEQFMSFKMLQRESFRKVFTFWRNFVSRNGVFI